MLPENLKCSDMLMVCPGYTYHLRNDAASGSLQVWHERLLGAAKYCREKVLPFIVASSGPAIRFRQYIEPNRLRLPEYHYVDCENEDVILRAEEIVEKEGGKLVLLFGGAKYQQVLNWSANLCSDLYMASSEARGFQEVSRGLRAKWMQGNPWYKGPHSIGTGIVIPEITDFDLRRN